MQTVVNNGDEELTVDELNGIIKMLQDENIELKQDLKLVKDTVTQVADVMGAIDADGNLNPNYTIRDAIGVVGQLATEIMTPGVVKGASDKVMKMLGIAGEKKPTMLERLAFVKNVFPLHDKYKHL
jgi:hypothetical protein